MDKYTEAIIELEELIDGIVDGCGSVRLKEAVELAIDSIKKQEPMMVTGDKHIYPNEYGVTMVEIECPSCGSCFEFESLRLYEPEYCDECGQKLKWRED